MFTIATSLILSSKLFAPSTPPFSFAPEELPWPLWGLPNSVVAAWKRWNGVQQPLPVTRLLCCYFCAVWLWRKAFSVLFTTASASWLSCNLWIHVPFELFKIIPVGGVCSGSSWSRQQGLWGLVLRAELGCHYPRSGLLWAGNFNFPSKYWDFPPALPSHRRPAGVQPCGSGGEEWQEAKVCSFTVTNPIGNQVQAPCRIPVKPCPKGETWGRSKLVFCWLRHSMFLRPLTSSPYAGSRHGSSFELSVKWNLSLMSDIFIICRGDS